MLKERINDDMKTYMRAKDTFALEMVRMLKADIKNAEIEMGIGKELSDEEILKVVRSSLKKHKEAAQISADAGRQDLLDKENRYIAVLEGYLPQQMSAEAVEQIARQVIAEMGDLDPKSGFGAAVKAVMARVGQAADGKLVSQTIKSILG